jgi:rod shape-determining protein MreC
MFVYAMRQWWGRYGVTAGLSVVVLLGAWSFRQSKGRILYELYSQISRPFEVPEDQAKIFTDARISELSANLAEEQQENARLRQLIGEAPKNLGGSIFAPVIGRSSDRWWQNIVIGRGKADGVSLDDVVVAPGGLIGRVSTVSANASRVILVSDSSSRVGVSVTRSRAAGVMRGVGGTVAIIEFFEKLPDVKVGDAITTSQFSQRFPSSIAIGTVTSVDLSASPAPQVEVELFAPIASLEWVSVHPHSKKPLDPKTELNSEFEVLLEDEE